MKVQDIASIDIEGIDTKDYPDFSNSFASYAEWKNGTPLTDMELEELNNKFPDTIHELAISTFH